jgi:hypothetical protein
MLIISILIKLLEEIHILLMKILVGASILEGNLGMPMKA